MKIHLRHLFKNTTGSCNPLGPADVNKRDATVNRGKTMNEGRSCYHLIHNHYQRRAWQMKFSTWSHLKFLSSAVKCSFKPSISSMFCFIPHLGNATNQMWITNDFILESKCHFQLFLEFLMSKHVQGCSRRKRPFLHTPMLGNTCKLFLPSK